MARVPASEATRKRLKDMLAATDGIERSAAPRIVRLPDSILRERLDEAARWIREKKNRQGDVVRLEEWCPRPVVEAVRDVLKRHV